MKSAAATVVLILIAVIVSIMLWGDPNGDAVLPAGETMPNGNRLDPGSETKTTGWPAETTGAEGRRREAIVPDREVDPSKGEKTFIIRGRIVRGEERSPVAGALLLMAEDLGRKGIFLPRAASRVGRSDSDGRFALEEERLVPPEGTGCVLMAACAEGIGWKTLTLVERQAERSNVEIALAPRTSLSVRVVDEGGFPLPGAAVRAEPSLKPLRSGGEVVDLIERIPPGKSPEVASIFSAAAEEDGIARFGILPVDENGTDYGVVAFLDGRTFAWRDMIGLKPGGEAEVTLTLHKHRRCALAGWILDWQGCAVAKARIELRLPGGEVRKTLSGASGEWRIDDIDPCFVTARLVVVAEGFARNSRGIRLPQAGDRTDIGFWLLRHARIAGIVVDDAGAPIEGAHVVLSHGRNRLELPTEGSRTERDGRFLFTEASEVVQWQLTVISPEPADDWIDQSVRIPVIGGHEDEIEVVLSRRRSSMARLVVEVVDSVTGEPLPPAGVKLSANDDETADVRNPSLEIKKALGAVVAEPVMPGSWRLWVHVEGRVAAYTDIVVFEGETEVSARVTVGRPGSIVGQVLLDETVPFGSAGIEAWFADERLEVDCEPWTESGVFHQCVDLDWDGVFRIDSLVPGRWKLELFAQGFGGSAETIVADGQETFVTIEPKGDTIRNDP